MIAVPVGLRTADMPLHTLPNEKEITAIPWPILL
jgi:hypothetical protein